MRHATLTGVDNSYSSSSIHPVIVNELLNRLPGLHGLLWWLPFLHVLYQHRYLHRYLCNAPPPPPQCQEEGTSHSDDL